MDKVRFTKGDEKESIPLQFEQGGCMMMHIFLMVRRVFAAALYKDCSTYSADISIGSVMTRLKTSQTEAAVMIRRCHQ